jgi:hypothetical protein
MADIPNPPAQDPISTGKWIARVILAVIVGEAIWSFLVSLTNGLIVPALARIMGGDPQSPVYLGKGDFNLTAIFVSILELCLAGIVAVVLNQWSRSGTTRVRVKTVQVKTVAAKESMPSIAPPAPRPTPSVSPAPVTSSSGIRPPASVAELAVALQATVDTPAAPQPRPNVATPAAPAPKPAATAAPKKPEKPREVYYNIVGEPINPTEDDG